MIITLEVKILTKEGYEIVAYINGEEYDDDDLNEPNAIGLSTCIAIRNGAGVYLYVTKELYGSIFVNKETLENAQFISVINIDLKTVEPKSCACCTKTDASGKVLNSITIPDRIK